MLAAVNRVEVDKGVPEIDGMQTTQLRDYRFLHP